jgi:hypothetical protein
MQDDIRLRKFVRDRARVQRSTIGGVFLGGVGVGANARAKISFPIRISGALVCCVRFMMPFSRFSMVTDLVSLST